MGRSVVAERHLREALGIRQGALPPGHWLIAASQSAVADALIAQRRFGEAESLLLAALPVLETSRGMEHEQTRLARERLARLYRASGRGPPARSAR